MYTKYNKNMVNFNNKYTILVIVLVAPALLFAVWGIYKIIITSGVDPAQQYAPHKMNGIYTGGRKRRHTKKVNKK